MMKATRLCLPLLVPLIFISAVSCRNGQQRAPGEEADGEVVNGLRLDLAAEPGRDGQPKLKLRVTNAGKQPFRLVDRGPLFLEVAGPGLAWQSYQHRAWGSDKVGTALVFEPGHSESEVEPVSAFAELPPGTYRVRIAMAIDAGMLTKYPSEQLWTGVLRSNAVTIAVPPR
jgi:hypothetical protein